MADLHEYPVIVKWTGGRKGKGTVGGDNSGTELPLGVPEEFGGDAGNGSNPEELLAKAVASCYTITLGIIADGRIPIERVETHAVGTVEQNGPANLKYQAITLKPTIYMGADATDEQVEAAEKAAHKADQYCIVSNVVREKVSITVEPTVQRG